MANRRPDAFKLNEQRLNSRMRAFLRQQLPQARKLVVRKLGFDVVADTVESLNGVDNHPKRIDTGRYRAGYRQGAFAVGLLGVGEAPNSTDPDNPSLPGDGYGTVHKAPDEYGLTIGNAVEYGPHVENGTSSMAPGHHLKRALRLAGDEFPPLMRERFAAAWNGEG